MEKLVTSTTRQTHMVARVLYGLTVQETAELEDLRRKWWSDHMSKGGTRSYSSREEQDAMRARRMALDEKHRRVWTELVGAQLALRTKPPLH